MNGKGLLTAKQSWEKKKNKVGRLTLPDFKTYYKAYQKSRKWNWYHNRHINQQNKTENPKIKPLTVG